MIRIVLVTPGAPGALVGAFPIAMQTIPHQARDLEDQARVIERQMQKLPLFVREMRRQGHADTILDKAMRLRGQQPLGRGLENEMREFQRFRVAQDVA